MESQSGRRTRPDKSLAVLGGTRLGLQVALQVHGRAKRDIVETLYTCARHL